MDGRTLFLVGAAMAGLLLGLWYVEKQKRGAVMADFTTGPWQSTISSTPIATFPGPSGTWSYLS